MHVTVMVLVLNDPLVVVNKSLAFKTKWSDDVSSSAFQKSDEMKTESSFIHFKMYLSQNLVKRRLKSLQHMFKYTPR